MSLNNKCPNQCSFESTESNQLKIYSVVAADANAWTSHEWMLYENILLNESRESNKWGEQ